MQHGSRPKRVYGLLVLGLVCFSASPILIKYATDAPPLTVAAWRSIFSVLFLLPFAVRSAIPTLLQLDRKAISLIGLGGVFLGIHFVLWIESLYFTSVASAATLVSASPIFIAILGYLLLKERLRHATIIAIAVAVVGTVAIGFGDAGGSGQQVNPPLGNALALSAALLVSLYLIIGRSLRQRMSWLAYVFGLYVVVMIVIVAIALIGGAPLFGLPAHIYGICALIALLPQIIGHGTFNYAIKYFDAAFLGLLSLTEPVGGSILAFFLFHEKPSVLSAVGLVVVLVGLSVGILGQRNGKRTPVPATD